jgi:hypothetical protein
LCGIEVDTQSFKLRGEKKMDRRAMMLSLLGGAAVVLGLDRTTPAEASVDVNVTVPVSDTLSNPCVPELVDISGDLHTLIHSTVDNAGGTSFDLHISFQGSGIGESSGVEYVSSSTFQDSTYVAAGGFPTEHTVDSQLKLISQGPLDNFLMTARMHMTINANDNITADVLSVTGVCQG